MATPTNHKRPPSISLLSPPSNRRPRISDSSISIIYLQDDNDNSGDDSSVEIISKKSHVHFSEIEHEVYYFKPYPVELVEPQEAKPKSKLTDQYTLLSSQHGRLRRQLRNISKTDLRAAIKYGVRTPANPGRNGEVRWKFEYNNVIFITDASCRQEITCFAPALRIDRHPVTNEEYARHLEVEKMLQQPELISGHTFIIVDQSGSMRESDVNGFRSRSCAAWSLLGLDFVGEQLLSRAKVQQSKAEEGDKMGEESGEEEVLVEAVTVIEMRNEGEIVVDRKPLDWILYNDLLKRADESHPKSHGNYNESLALVKSLIEKEYGLLKDLERAELPNFNVVFLSDGKPSDGYQSHQSRADVDRFDSERVAMLSSLSKMLLDKFSFYAMGVAANRSEFGALSKMVEVVKQNGGMGRFVHAGLDAVQMGEGLSAISTTMTSLRTDLMGEGSRRGGGSEKKDFKMRETGKIVGKVFEMENFINGKNYTIKRFRYDKDLYKKGQSPWKDVGFAAHGANGFEMEKRPLGEGAERLAYRFNEIKFNNQTNTYQKVGNVMVAKNSILANEKETKEHFHHDFCRVQSAAYDLAEKFNHAVRQATCLKSVSSETRPPELKFVMCHVYTYTNLSTNEETAVLVERFLNGKFTKYNSNNGYVKQSNEGVHNTRTIELLSGKAHLEEFLQAFSHWVYVHTQHRMVVCDLQGVLNEEGRYPEFLLTDPAICTSKGPRFGKTDMKLTGIRKFCASHRCGLVCRGLGLKGISTSLLTSSEDR